MFTPGTYAADPPPRPKPLLQVGLKHLDELTGGIPEQSLWVITGPPRSGRTMLALQIVRRAASSGVPVRLVLGRDGAREVVSRLRAGSLHRSLRSCRREDPAADEPWLEWPIEFDPEANRYEQFAYGAPKSGLLVVDDFDMWR